jgi:hypothetical protein
VSCDMRMISDLWFTLRHVDSVLDASVRLYVAPTGYVRWIVARDTRKMRATSTYDLPPRASALLGRAASPSERWDSDMRPALLGGFHARDGALFDDLALELSDGTEDVIQEPPGGRRCVEPLAYGAVSEDLTHEPARDYGVVALQLMRPGKTAQSPTCVPQRLPGDTCR